MRPRHLRHAAMLLALLAATCAAYRSVGELAFLAHDDPTVVVGNPHVVGGLTAQNVRWSLAGLDVVNWYPVTWLSHQATVELFGLSPAAHHRVNLLFHLLGTALLYLALAWMTGAAWRAAAVAALFALHPLHVESVAWVSERSDVVAGALWGATLLAWAWYARRPAAGRYAVVAALFALALAAKATVVTLPCLLLVLDLWPLGRGRLGRQRASAPGAAGWGRLVAEKVPLVALSGAAAALTMLAQSRAGAVKTFAVLPVGARLANALLSYAAYLEDALWPAGLALYYPATGTAFPRAGVAAAGCALLAVTALALWFARSRPALLVGWLWFLGVLVPVIGLVQAGDQARADRFTYLPLTGLFVAGAWGVAGACRRHTRCLAAVAGASVAVIGLLAAATARQVGFWRTTEAAYEHALAVTEGNSFVEYNLAVLLHREGRYAEAAAHYRAALRIDPRLVEAHFNLGVALAESGDIKAAVASYGEALRLDPASYPAWFNLGVDLLSLGDLAGAERALAAAVRLRPASAGAHEKLGAVYSRQGRFAEAAAQRREALRLAPGDPEYRRP